MAPEILLGLGKYDEKVDIWSIGTIIFELLTGKAVFKADSMESLKEQVKIGKINFADIDCSDDLKKFLRNLLKINPLERWGWKELLISPFMCMDNEKYKELYKNPNPFEEFEDGKVEKEDATDCNKVLENIAQLMHSNYNTLIQLFDQCIEYGTFMKRKDVLYCLFLQASKDMANLISILSKAPAVDEYRKNIIEKPIAKIHDSEKEILTINFKKQKDVLNITTQIVPLFKQVCDYLLKFGDLDKKAEKVSMKSILDFYEDIYKEGMAANVHQPTLQQAKVILEMLIMQIQYTSNNYSLFAMIEDEYIFMEDNDPEFGDDDKDGSEKIVNEIRKCRDDLSSLLEKKKK